jgi:hypothetical protein
MKKKNIIVSFIKKNGYQSNFIHRELLLALFFLLFILSGISAQPSYSEGFKLIKANSHYEPELVVKPAITLPGTNIKAGSYIYVLSNGMEIGRWGFLISSEKFYFVQSSEYNLIAPDFNYGVYNEYFVMDASGYASTSGHNRLMFLFKYNKDSVQLLDVIGKAYVVLYGMDFISVSDRQKDCITNCPPGQIIIGDIDHNSNPEIKLIISMGNRFKPLDFELYFEIFNNRLQVNFSPVLYKPLFEREKQNIQTETKSDAYYIYGFLAGRLILKEIKPMLKTEKKQYKRIITLLENLKKWDSAFHEVNGEKFILKQYNLKRR